MGMGSDATSPDVGCGCFTVNTGHSALPDIESRKPLQACSPQKCPRCEKMRAVTFLSTRYTPSTKPVSHYHYLSRADSTTPALSTTEGVQIFRYAELLPITPMEMG